MKKERHKLNGDEDFVVDATLQRDDQSFSGAIWEQRKVSHARNALFDNKPNRKMKIRNKKTRNNKVFSEASDISSDDNSNFTTKHNYIDQKGSARTHFTRTDSNLAAYFNGHSEHRDSSPKRKLQKNSNRSPTTKNEAPYAKIKSKSRKNKQKSKSEFVDISSSEFTSSDEPDCLSHRDRARLSTESKRKRKKDCSLHDHVPIFKSSKIKLEISDNFVDDFLFSNSSKCKKAETFEDEERTQVAESLGKYSDALVADSEATTFVAPNGAAESNVCKVESSKFRQKLESLLEKKPLTPIKPEVTLRGLKIDLNPKNSILNTVATYSTNETQVTSKLSKFSSVKLNLERNLAPSRFTTECKKEFGYVDAKNHGPLFRKEDPCSSEESEEEKLVFQGCANKPEQQSEEFDISLYDSGIGICSKLSQGFSDELKLKSTLSPIGNIMGNHSTAAAVPTSCAIGELVAVETKEEKFEGCSFQDYAMTDGQERKDICIKIHSTNDLVENKEPNERCGISNSDYDISFFCSQVDVFFKAKLSEDVVLELDQLFADGFLIDDLPDDVIDSLSKLDSDLALFVFQQFRESDFSKVRNKSLFFKGKVKLAVMKGKALMKGAGVKILTAKEIALKKLKEYQERDEKLDSKSSIDESENPELIQGNQASPIEINVLCSESSTADDDFSSDLNDSNVNFSTPVFKMCEVAKVVESEQFKSLLACQNKWTDDIFESISDVSHGRKNTLFSKFADHNLMVCSNFSNDLMKPSLHTRSSSTSMLLTPADTVKAPFVPQKRLELRTKPQLTDKRGGTNLGFKQHSEPTTAFSNEVATLNQILICGAGPSNYVPHQEGQYSPNKLRPNYEKLAYLIRATNYAYDDSEPCTRCFGPPLDWKGSRPGKDCKLFIGKLPCDVFEDDLIPVLFEAGNIYELRVLLDPNTRLNKGFCFVTMCTKIETDRALRLLNGRFIRPRHKMIVKREVKFNQLFIGNLPRDKNENEIMAAFSRLYTGVVGVDLIYKSDSAVNSGFCVLNFDSFEKAKFARDIMHRSPREIKEWEQFKDYCCDWAIPNDVLHEKKPDGSTTVLVKHLKLNARECELREHFISYGNVSKVILREHHAYIVFTSNKEALTAVKASQTDGLTVQIVEHDPEETGKLVPNRLYADRGETVSKFKTLSARSDVPRPQTVRPQHSLSIGSTSLPSFRISSMSNDLWMSSQQAAGEAITIPFLRPPPSPIGAIRGKMPIAPRSPLMSQFGSGVVGIKNISSSAVQRQVDARFSEGQLNFDSHSSVQSDLNNFNFQTAP